VKRFALGLEIGAALGLSPLILWGGREGTLLYFALISALALRGALRELSGPLERVRGKQG
jgi:hypothetical protein